jgi:hypothetical protein
VTGLTALVVLVAGLLVGLTSIGGVLVVPALHHLGGFTVAHAVACASVAMLGPGLWVWARAARGEVSRPLVISATMGALIGAPLVHFAPGVSLLALVGVLCIASGFVALKAPNQDAKPVASLGTWSVIAIGLFVGALSTLTGTGGPVVLLPILMLLGRDLSGAVGWALVVQLPIGMTAAITHAVASPLVLSQVLLVGGLMLGGVIAGQHLSRFLAIERLRAAVGATLLVCGALLIGRLVV